MPGNLGRRQCKPQDSSEARAKRRRLKVAVAPAERTAPHLNERCTKPLRIVVKLPPLLAISEVSPGTSASQRSADLSCKQTPRTALRGPYPLPRNEAHGCTPAVALLVASHDLAWRIGTSFRSVFCLLVQCC